MLSLNLRLQDWKSVQRWINWSFTHYILKKKLPLFLQVWGDFFDVQVFLKLFEQVFLQSLRGLAVLLHPGVPDDVDQGRDERLLDHFVPLLDDWLALQKHGKDKLEKHPHLRNVWEWVFARVCFIPVFVFESGCLMPFILLLSWVSQLTQMKNMLKEKLLLTHLYF